MLTYVIAHKKTKAKQITHPIILGELLGRPGAEDIKKGGSQKFKMCRILKCAGF